jgi:two-component system OmpR family response regulator
MPRVLVIDDEPRIGEFLSRALSSQGFGVDVAHDGERGLGMAKSGRYALVLLDLMLPGLDGYHVLQQLVKTSPDKPVLVLSAISDVRSKVRCLELGASDYLSKPFELAELVARVRARLRQPSNGPIERILFAGNITLDLLRRTADAGEGPVSLSEREFLLLQHLMRRAGDVCAREELLEDVWGYSFDPGTNVVDVYVGRVRAKLGSSSIETVRSVGYALRK